MATRKKKSDTIDSTKIVLPETKVVKGSHLTITYTNGYPEKLEWDDDALLNDVRLAILKVESTIPVSTDTTAVKPKRSKKSK